FRGIEDGLPKLLSLFEKHGVRANFFATSDLCSRHPDALREIVRRGHVLGCHGESHDVAYLSSRSYRWQVASIRRATESLEACTGVRPRGFRAPNFSANGATIRALERLGYDYDSSVLPGRVVR
ncbi:MAG: polysaccharide deacetylase family protein, partial [Candidatus Thermoplasmatota archaeon]